MICLAALLLWIPRGRIIWMQRSMTLSEFDSSGMAVLGIWKRRHFFFLVSLFLRSRSCGRAHLSAVHAAIERGAKAWNLSHTFWSGGIFQVFLAWNHLGVGILCLVLSGQLWMGWRRPTFCWQICNQTTVQMALHCSGYGKRFGIVRVDFMTQARWGAVYRWPPSLRFAKFSQCQGKNHQVVWPLSGKCLWGLQVPSTLVDKWPWTITH